MADVREPVRVGSDGDATTSPDFRVAPGTDVLAASRALAAEDVGSIVERRWSSAPVMVGGALFIAFVVALVASVVIVSESSKQPLLQPIPSPPTTSAPISGPTVANGPLPVVPATPPMLPPPPVNIPAPAETVAPSPETVTPSPVMAGPSPVTATPAAPEPRPKPRLPRLRDLVPRLSPKQ